MRVSAAAFGEDSIFTARDEGTRRKGKAVRATFVNQYFRPDEAATAQLLSDLVEVCAARGASCRVVCSDRSYADPARRYPRREELPDAVVERFPASGFGRSSRVGRVADYATFLLGAARGLLSGPKPDVIVGMSTPPILGALAVAVARLRGCRSAYWAMDVYPDLAFELGAMGRGSLAGRSFGAVSRWTLRRADLVVALGETMAARLTALGARNAVAVHNWADGEAIRPAAPASRDRLVVLYSGNLGLAHEFGTLLSAAEKLRKEAVTFVFQGGGPRLAEVKEEAARCGLLNVEFRPAAPRERLGESLAEGDVHVVTLRPGMPGLLVPSKIYGILAAGRPVLYVGPFEGEVFDIISRAECGECVAPGDVAGAVAALRRWVDDAPARREAGMAGRVLFERSFTRAGQCGRLAALLEAVARRGTEVTG